LKVISKELTEHGSKREAEIVIPRTGSYAEVGRSLTE